MDPEIRVEFHLVGNEITPQEITDILGITPSRIFIKGEKRFPKLNLKPTHKENAWSLRASKDISSLDINDYIKPVVEILFPIREKLIILCEEKDLYSELSCVIEIIEQSPIMHLEPDLISKIALLQTHIDFDIILTEE